MKPPKHVAGWITGVSVLALFSAGIAAATTEPPDTTLATDDTAMATDDTAMGATSEPMAGAGPSDCPAITAETTEAPVGTEAPAVTGEAAATTEVAAATEAVATIAPAETGAAETTMAGTMAVETSPPVEGPFVQIAETDEYGPILVDGQCFALYAFTQDTAGEPTCVDDCAANWPPLFVTTDAVPPLADELDPTLFSVVQHPDGPMLMIGQQPLYYFANDTAPGDLNGQGVGGVWWLVSPDGTLLSEEGAEDTVAETEAPAGTEPTGTMQTGTVTETTIG